LGFGRREIAAFGEACEERLHVRDARAIEAQEEVNGLIAAMAVQDVALQVGEQALQLLMV
jgi:hypothetical protein